MAEDEETAPWQPAIRKGGGPLYLAIADALASDIQSGALAAGTRLPTQRRLAEALGIDFTTVTRAYTEARRRGLIEGRVGHGTFVRARPSPRALSPSSSIVDMAMNLPPRFADARLAARLWQGIATLEAGDGLDLLLCYQEPGGTVQDRAAGAQWLGRRFPLLATERLLVSAGTQGALLAITSQLTVPGDVVCVEALTYPGFRALASHLRLRLAPVEIDAEGLVPEAFAAACRRERPKALYCTPTLHNPTTATMSLARRTAIAAVAREHGVPIIEDDAYAMLPAAPLPPLATLAPELTYYVAGLAKCLSPALRVAYVVPPDASAAARLAGAIRATTTMASPLTVATATRWIEDGTADAVTAAIRAEAAARRAILRALLPDGVLSAPVDAFHAWLALPPPWTSAMFVARLRSAGIGVVGADQFAAGTAPEAVRLSLGAARTRDELSAGLAVVADLLAERPRLSALVV
ncbi:GntR family transcriptional regulator [Aliidongia dinghuensis]|uniref:GntR family transcriptional regulator n=1 Tax=Aliidongia dinghuensis TaxID=1867774 RepID=A0A8J3E3D0_9PROT|nr:PLP-dependent aminotransferase family protein [Aliidongia dinghuensis]GGF05597.1 GntR family transcriptional regulator [Aliidongia dinghuensis]